MFHRSLRIDVVQDDAGWHVRLEGQVILTCASEDEATGQAAKVMRSIRAEEERGERRESRQ